MASGSSGRAGTGAKGFDFGSDDILCSYEDYGGGINHDSSANGTHSGPSAATSAMDFHKSRMARSSVLPAISYAQPEDSFNQDVISTVEKSMKKHTENLMRFLEGISSRLSQLELYCYNLDKSIGEMRSDLVRDHGEADTKLKSLEKHIQEVHRSVQILRDKQELADAQKELTKLQLVQKDSSSSNHSYSSEEKASGPASDLKKSENASEMHNQQLALALPHQVLPQQQPPPPIPPPAQAPPTQNVGQQQSYYLPPTQLPTQPPQPQHHPQSQYIPPSDPQYRASQMQDISRISPQPTQIQPGQQFPPYQQQWPPQQLPPQVQPPQQPSVQPQMRPPSTTVYPPFQSAGQPTNQSPEMLPNNVPMQVSYSAVPQPLTSGADAVPYGYGAGRTVPQPPPPQQIKGGFGPQPGDGYATAGPHPALPPGSSYMMYDSEGGRTLHAPQQSHFPRGGYPPSNLPLQNAQPTAGGNMLGHNPSPSQYMRGHPYSELIDKLVSMGFRGDIVIGVIQRMEESGQPVDFNAVLDRLSAPSSGSSQRAWSG